MLTEALDYNGEACDRFGNATDTTEGASPIKRPLSIHVTPSPTMEVRLGVLGSNVPSWGLHDSVWSQAIQVVVLGSTNDPV